MISIPFLSSSSARSVGATSSLMRERETSLTEAGAAHRNGHRDFPPGLRLASRPVSLVGFSQNAICPSSATAAAAAATTGASTTPGLSSRFEHVTDAQHEEQAAKADENSDHKQPDLDVNIWETLSSLDDARETALVGSDEEADGEPLETEPLLLGRRIGSGEKAGSPARLGFGAQQHATHTHDCKSDGCQRVSINVSGLVWETRLAILNRHPTTLFGNLIKRAKYYNSKRNGTQNLNVFQVIFKNLIISHIKDFQFFSY